MTHDEIQAFALAAGFHEYDDSCLSGLSDLDCLVAVCEYPIGESLVKFAALIRGQTIEECAKVAGSYRMIGAGTIKDAIMALKQ